jgi:acyl-CoA synthetase (AMP-forming)/AMP-acid ligase II
MTKDSHNFSVKSIIAGTAIEKEESILANLTKREDKFPLQIFSMRQLMSHATKDVCLGPLPGTLYTDTDVAVIPFSSGTTGHQKAVKITYRQVGGNIYFLTDKR